MVGVERRVKEVDDVARSAHVLEKSDIDESNSPKTLTVNERVCQCTWLWFGRVLAHLFASIENSATQRDRISIEV